MTKRYSAVLTIRDYGPPELVSHRRKKYDGICILYLVKLVITISYLGLKIP